MLASPRAGEEFVALREPCKHSWSFFFWGGLLLAVHVKRVFTLVFCEVLLFSAIVGMKYL